MNTSFLPSIMAITVITIGYWLLFRRQGLTTEFIVFSTGKLSRAKTGLLYLASTILFLALWDITSRLEPVGINKIPSPVDSV